MDGWMSVYLEKKRKEIWKNKEDRYAWEKSQEEGGERNIFASLPLTLINARFPLLTHQKKPPFCPCFTPGPTPFVSFFFFGYTQAVVIHLLWNRTGIVSRYKWVMEVWSAMPKRRAEILRWGFLVLTRGEERSARKSKIVILFEDDFVDDGGSKGSVFLLYFESDGLFGDLGLDSFPYW